jgi:hypothetical protein
MLTPSFLHWKVSVSVAAPGVAVTEKVTVLPEHANLLVGFNVTVAPGVGVTVPVLDASYVQIAIVAPVTGFTNSTPILPAVGRFCEPPPLVL